MSKRTITYKAEDFQYPSSEERAAARESYPDIHHFNFEYINTFLLMFQEDKSPWEIDRKNNLFWWDNNLQSKIAKLYLTFINVHTHYHRGIPNNEKEYSDKNYMNKLQFDYYSETLFYFLFSCRDIVLQIINTFYKLGIDDGKVCLRTINKELKEAEPKVLAEIESLNKNIKTASDIRNSLTHKYPLNKPDNRTKIIESADGLTFHGETGNFKNPDEIMENIISSLNHFSNFLKALKPIMGLTIQ